MSNARFSRRPTSPAYFLGRPGRGLGPLTAAAAAPSRHATATSVGTDASAAPCPG